MRILIVVVLPAPLGPSKPTISPARCRRIRPGRHESTRIASRAGQPESSRVRSSVMGSSDPDQDDEGFLRRFAPAGSGAGPPASGRRQARAAIAVGAPCSARAFRRGCTARSPDATGTQPALTRSRRTGWNRQSVLWQSPRRSEALRSCSIVGCSDGFGLPSSLSGAASTPATGKRILQGRAPPAGSGHRQTGPTEWRAPGRYRLTG